MRSAAWDDSGACDGQLQVAEFATRVAKRLLSSYGGGPVCSAPRVLRDSTVVHSEGVRHGFRTCQIAKLPTEQIARQDLIHSNPETCTELPTISLAADSRLRQGNHGSLEDNLGGKASAC